MNFAELIQVTNAQVFGVVNEALICKAFSTDSRTIEDGQIFIALQGQNFDGHQFVNQAIEKGAAAALVNRYVELESEHFIQLVVEDTLKAYGQLAAFHAQAMPAKKIAITGSSGKTTVKQMLMAVCGEAGSVCATQGNFNNDIGVPRTLLSIKQNDAFAVVEMGANHKGEIGYLSSLLKADAVSVINADRAHLEGFGSIEGVAHAKGEIFSGAKTGGLAVLNLDEPYFSLWKSLSEQNKLKLVSCSMVNEQADIFVLSVKAHIDGSEVALRIFGDKHVFKIPFPGEHNVKNALIVVGITVGLGLDVSVIKQGLAKAKPEKGRLNKSICSNGIILIDDTYNANPLSVKAAIKLLAQYPNQKVLILGDMGELGSEAASMHEEVGKFAVEHNIDVLLAYGEFAANYLEGFSRQQFGKAYKTQIELINELPDWLNVESKPVVLVKGSRFTRMEKVVDYIREWGEAA